MNYMQTLMTNNEEATLTIPSKGITSETTIYTYSQARITN